jgi:hypothetical protein
MKQFSVYDLNWLSAVALQFWFCGDSDTRFLRDVACSLEFLMQEFSFHSGNGEMFVFDFAWYKTWHLYYLQ